MGPDGEAIFEPEPDGGDVQAGGNEDAGEKGVNYTNAPLHRRLGAAPGVLKVGASSPAWASVFSSMAHGDPRTPLARAYAGDQLRMRVLGANRPRQMGFQLDGASWRQEPYDTESPLVGVQGGIGTGKAVNAHVRLAAAGDHLWSSPTTMSLAQGVWGMARVYPGPTAGPGFVPTPLPSPDNPFTTGTAPLQPLERSSLSVLSFTDANGDGTRDAAEAVATGTEVRLLSTSGARLATTTTVADGTAVFSPLPGAYDVEVVPPPGTAVVGNARRRVDLTADGARADLSVAIAPLGTLRATVFEDADADGVRDAGEGVASGWSVTLSGSSTVTPVTTGVAGTADFSGLRAGSWAVSVAPRSGWRTTTGDVQATVGADPGRGGHRGRPPLRVHGAPGRRLRRRRRGRLGRAHHRWARRGGGSRGRCDHPLAHRRRGDVGRPGVSALAGAGPAPRQRDAVAVHEGLRRDRRRLRERGVRRRRLALGARRRPRGGGRWARSPTVW